MVQVTKQYVLEEINRLAQANGGVAPGIGAFERETGIKKDQVIGILWPRWSEAVQDAGLQPNQLQIAYDKSELLGRYAAFARELGRLPTKGELGVRHHSDPLFPSLAVWGRFGKKEQLVEAVADYCNKEECQDVLQMCVGYIHRDVVPEQSTRRGKEFGFVYMVKSGRHFKIGRSNATGRREYEIALQLPQRASKIHEIRTDDPAGIEEYWHKRFADKRRNGEWFELTAGDVAAFRRRKFM